MLQDSPRCLVIPAAGLGKGYAAQKRSKAFGFHKRVTPLSPAYLFLFQEDVEVAVLIAGAGEFAAKFVVAELPRHGGPALGPHNRRAVGFDFAAHLVIRRGARCYHGV